MALEGNLVKLEGLGMNPSRVEQNFFFKLKICKSNRTSTEAIYTEYLSFDHCL